MYILGHYKATNLNDMEFLSIETDKRRNAYVARVVQFQVW